MEYTEFDRCPACNKKVMNMVKSGKVLTFGVGVVCNKCGNIFVLKRTLDDLLKRSESMIVLPGQKGLLRTLKQE